jgi:uncharacterized protein
MRGNFVWHELMTTDTQSAGSFYPRVTGWKTRPWEHDSRYTLFEGSAGPMGGMMVLPEDAKSMGAPPSWLPYIGTSDIAGTLSHAQRLGGRVLKDVQDIPAVGKWAVLADPQGGTFALLQPASQAPQKSGRALQGDFSWHELATTDHRAAMEFYGDLFGWRKSTAHDMGPMGIYQLFSIGGSDAGGMFNKDPEVPVHWLSYVNVNDADAAARAAAAAGGKVVNGPMEVPGGDRIAQIVDPQGGAFAVHAFRKAAAKPATPAKPAAGQPATASKPAAAASPTATAAVKPAAAKPARPAAKRRASGRKSAPRRKAASSGRRGARKTARSGRSAARKTVRSGRKAARKAARSVRRVARKAVRSVRRAVRPRRAKRASSRRASSSRSARRRK